MPSCTGQWGFHIPQMIDVFQADIYPDVECNRNVSISGVNGVLEVMLMMVMLAAGRGGGGGGVLLR